MRNYGKNQESLQIFKAKITLAKDKKTKTLFESMAEGERGQVTGLTETRGKENF